MNMLQESLQGTKTPSLLSFDIYLFPILIYKKRKVQDRNTKLHTHISNLN